MSRIVLPPWTKMHDGLIPLFLLSPRPSPPPPPPPPLPPSPSQPPRTLDDAVRILSESMDALYTVTEVHYMYYTCTMYNVQKMCVCSSVRACSCRLLTMYIVHVHVHVQYKFCDYLTCISHLEQYTHITQTAYMLHAKHLIPSI